jgi:hypothetical protein
MTAPTPAQQEAAILAAQQTLAAEDLTVLQTFQTVATTSSSTIAQLEAAMTTAKAGLGDPGRLASLTSILGGYDQFLSNLATLISQTNAAAGN